MSRTRSNGPSCAVGGSRAIVNLIERDIKRRQCQLPAGRIGRIPAPAETANDRTTRPFPDARKERAGGEETA